MSMDKIKEYVKELRDAYENGDYDMIEVYLEYIENELND